MGITTIYADDQTNEIVKRIKLENPNFNLSAYVKECLVNWTGEYFEDESTLKQLREAREKCESLQKKYDEIKRKKEAKEKIEKEMLIKEEAMKEQTILYQKVVDYFDRMPDQEKDIYKQGIRDKKWDGSLEYYNKMVKEEEIK